MNVNQKYDKCYFIWKSVRHSGLRPTLHFPEKYLIVLEHLAPVFLLDFTIQWLSLS